MFRLKTANFNAQQEEHFDLVPHDTSTEENAGAPSLLEDDRSKPGPLRNIFSNIIELTPSGSFGEIIGRRIVDLSYIFAQIKNVNHDIGLGCIFIDMDFVSEDRRGCYLKCWFICKMCNINSKICTVKESPKTNWSINKAIVNSTIAIELTGPTSFVCKSTSTHLKVQTEKSDDYRKIIHFLNENNASFHTYQLQSEKSYRVVIRNFHPSTPTADISSAIEEIGFLTRHKVTNINHHQTKMALPMFFVDLEPDPSNKDIFNIKSMLHTLVKVEEPHKRRDIPQCLNCQSYGHPRAYCSYPPRCVKCGEDHTTSLCKITPDTPATCALCSGSQPANYKRCTVHEELQNRRRHPLTSSKLTQKPIKSSLLNALLHQPAHHLPIFNQTRALDLIPM
ncbi:hypothetical protein QTP88_013237 [Uroleucon formosanum]